jgi:hypothetical protein
VRQLLRAVQRAGSRRDVRPHCADGAIVAAEPSPHTSQTLNPQIATPRLRARITRATAGPC